MGTMTVDQIINGSEEFPGLIPMIDNYVSSMEVDADTRCTISKYLQQISKRASGEIPTTAKWMRNFVLEHPDYKKDSVVTETINYDLLKECVKIQECSCWGLLSKTTDIIPEALSKSEDYLNQKNPYTYENVIPV